jgi:cell division protease FtsH
MVTRYGFSALGPQALEGEGVEVFLGRDWLRPQPAYSQETGNRIDAQVRAQAQAALDRAVAMLRPRRDLMDALVDRLIAEETIEGEAFRSLVAGWEEAAGAASGGASTGQAPTEPDVETAQVGV